jgi:Lamin Tail Domain
MTAALRRERTGLAWVAWVSPFAMAALLGAFGPACSTETTVKPAPAPVDDTEFFEEDPAPLTPDYIDGDAGIVIGSRTRDGGMDAAVPDGQAPRDSGRSDGATPDAGACATLAAGSLFITELMIASRAGSGDDGEWVELRNTQNCVLSLDGITVQSPRGTGVADSVTLSGSLAPGETVIAAASGVASANHSLPGKVFSFGAPDVLKNDGDTVTVSKGPLVIDTFTYPKIVLRPGSSIALPSDCTATNRADIARWSFSAKSWTPGFFGTPNAPNDDVSCF